MTIDALADHLRGHRFTCGTEEALQDGLAAVLAGAGIEFVREHVLPAKGRIDFYVPAVRIGIETKVKGGWSATVRQVHGYACEPEIAGVILVTRRARQGVVPAAMNGKPVRVVQLWSSGL